MHEQKKPKLVYGKGINDADYHIGTYVNGIQVLCPFYSKWKDMLRRAYDETYKINKPSYQDVVVCEAWLRFSNFRTWMLSQPWEDRELDKDILVPGNKIYSPEFCMFVPREINSIFSEKASKKREYPLGVYADKIYPGKFTAYCSVRGKLKYLGYHKHPMTAHVQWQLTKVKNIQEAAQLARGLYSDERLYQALVYRSSMILVDLQEGRETMIV